MRKPFTRKKRTTTKPTLTRQVAVIKKLVATRAPEKKYYDVGSTGNVIDNLPSYNITPYRNITQGLGDYANRIGDKITIASSVNFRSTWRLNGATSLEVRLVAFIFKRNPDSVTSTWSTIINLYLSSAYMNSELAVKANQDWDNAKSFHTVYDQTRVINPNGENTDALLKWNVNFQIPQKYREIAYSAGGTGVNTNELFIGLISQYDTSTLVNWHYRFAYTDS